MSGSMTISAWIKPGAFPVYDAAIVSKRADSGYELNTSLDQGSRTIGFKLSDSFANDMVRYGATTLETDTWRHVAGVYDAVTGALNVYLDGKLDNGALIGEVTATQLNSGENVNIGQRPAQPGVFNFAGEIDD